MCLRTIERRRRTPKPLDPEEAEIASYLQPYPDRLLGLEVEERESVSLAFVSVMQFLPPRQRAVLVLHDVLGWSAREVAELLGTTVASVNSALQRARQTLARERAAGRLARDHVPASSDAEARIVSSFLAAWEAVDVEDIVALLADNAIMTMPPEPMRLVGRDGIGEFFRTVPAAGASSTFGSCRRARTGNRRSPPISWTTRAPTPPTESWSSPWTTRRITSITGFAGYPELFPELRLPDRLSG